MNTIERTIYIGLIALMVGVGSLSYLPKLTEQNKESAQTQESEDKSFTQPVLLTVELGGYVSYVDVSKEPFTFSRTYWGGKRIDIEIASMHQSYEEFMEEKQKAGKTPKLNKGPNGWEYYMDEYWDPTGKSNMEGGNVYRIFLKEEDGVLVTITQYDYTGGKYNKEVDNLVSKIKLYGTSY